MPRNVLMRSLNVPCSRSDRLLLMSARSPSDCICLASGRISLIGFQYDLSLSVGLRLLLVSGISRLRRAKHQKQTQPGQAFTTGSETNGYTVTSVTIRSEDPNHDPIPLQICEVDESTHPTTECWDLTGPPTYPNLALLTYTAPTDPALTLDASTTYMVVFKAPPSGDLLRVDATSSAGEDDTSLAGWSIRDKFQWNNGGTWQDASGSRVIRITITGTVTPPPPPLASNIGQSDGTTGLTQLFDFAQPFSTGNHDEGYTLEDISIRLHTSSTATVAPVLTLHSGSGTGTKVADFNGPSALTSDTVKNYEYTPTTPVTLEMSTEYWVVVDQGGAGVSVQLTASDSEDGTPVDGASIGNAAHSRGASSTGSFSQHSGTTPSLMIKVNGTARPTTPTVSSVAITSDPGMDNTYATGDTITVSLTFSEAVTVTGTPHVVVDIGGQPRNFSYSGDGSSAAAQPFSYTVLVGDRDSDGVSLLANSLTLNGGTIQAADDSTNATLTHAAMTFANHKVDTNVTLVSNIGQTDAPETITVSEAESATASFTIERRSPSKDYTLKEIVLDVKTASDMLDVTITVSLDIDPSANYVFSGSVATTGRQVFSLDDPFQQLAQIHYDAVTYELTISGAGSGTVEIGATASSGQDSGGLSWWGVADPPSGKSIPRFKLHGYEDTNPFIYHAEIISSPDDGTTYRAGERIEVFVVLTEPLRGPVPAEAEIWLGTQAQHRRAASLAACPRNTAGEWFGVE